MTIKGGAGALAILLVSSTAGCGNDQVSLGGAEGSTGTSSSSGAETDTSGVDESSDADSGSSSDGADTTDGDDGLCGNFQPDPGEVCDDGNNDDGDGCNADCSEATCWVPVTHPTIQDAVNDLACPTVWLAPGIHHERVVIGRDVELAGIGGIIDGSFEGTVVEIQRGVSVVLRHIRVAHGRAERGGGVYSLGTLELRDGANVDGNDAEGAEPCGGGVWSDGTVILHGGGVSHNEVKAGAPLGRGAGLCMVGGRLELHEGSEVSGNHSRANGSSTLLGSGIHAEGTDIVITSGSVVSGNVADIDDAAPGALVSGGGIYLQGGSLLIEDSAVSDSRALIDGEAPAEGSVLARGGGLALYDVQASIARSEFYGNRASAGGGGTLLIARGGGIHVEGGSVLTIDDSTFDFSSASGVAPVADVETAVMGGAIHVDASTGDVILDVSDSLFTTNRITTYSLVDNDDSPRFSAGAGIFATSTRATGSASIRVERSTFYDGRSQHGAAVFLRADEADATVEFDLVNSTVFDNRGDMGAFFGASATEGSVVARVRSSTITDNPGDVGGIWFAPASPGASIDLANTLLADNQNDCAPADSTITSLGYNAFGSPECAPVPATGDAFIDDPGVDWLADNGGPTETCALLPDSPLLDAGDPAGCLDTDGAVLTVDQRGEERHATGRCDIGAFELGR